MADLSSFPITRLWPAKNPDVIQLYSLPTPNGVKASIMLEELGLPYEAHRIDIGTNVQKSPEFLSLNPNGRIPAIIDPEGPGGKPFGVFESGAILLYLAEKTDRLLPADPAARYEAIQWLFFQMGGVGPMFGQFGHFFKYAADKVANNSYPVDRYREETKRLLGVLEIRLRDHEWLAGHEYSIADIATFPWVRAIETGYGARDVIGLENFPAVAAWRARAEARPASVRGLAIPAAG